MNLVLVNVKNIEADTFFTLLQEMFIFFSCSVVHSIFIEIQKQILNAKKSIELKMLCHT